VPLAHALSDHRTLRRPEIGAIHVIGCDIGTQSLKAVLLDEQGATVARASAAYGVDYPRPGWAQQRPETWIAGLEAALPALLAEAGIEAQDVGALGLATQVDGVVAVDADLTPLAPAIIWMDRRATDQTRQLRRRLGGTDTDTLAITGCNLDASHVGPKIMWLRDEAPEVAARARTFLLPGSYLVAYLTGELVVDHANASSTLLYDINARAWSTRMLDAAGVDRTTLADIRPAHDVVGTLRPAVAERLGLDAACRVVVGTGDEHGACLAAGAVDKNVICDITGTAEPVAVGTDRPVLDPTGLVETHGHADDRLWLIENPGFVSGGSVRWFLDLFGASEGDLDRIGEVEPGSGGVTFLPTLSGATTPVWDEEIRGAFAGLGLNHGFAHLARAVLEGCTFALRDLVDRFAELGLGGTEIRVVGGGARSVQWLQMKADVTGRVVRVLTTDEATALGAAELAAVGGGLFRDLDEAVEALTHLEPQAYEPNPATRDAYETAYRRYRDTFAAIAATGGPPA